MTRDTAHSWLAVAALAALAVVLHGYHFGIEDQTLYLPAIARHLDPTLFPHDAAFFSTETRFTLFDELMAAAVRWTPLALDVVVFLVYVASLCAVIRACQRLARACFEDAASALAGTLVVVILLPFPVAGTRMGLFEWYLHPRGPAIALMLWALVAAIERRARAGPLVAFAMAIHPLSGFWGAGHVLLQGWPWRWRLGRIAALGMTLLAVACTAPARPADWETEYWRHALEPEYFGIRYPLNWPWYEWVGVVAPLAVLAGIAHAARTRGATTLARVSGRLAVSGILGVAIAVALTASPSRRLPLQPMRELHLVYYVALLFLGCAVERWWLRGRWGLRLVCVAALVAGVLIGQPRFAHSERIEWPGRVPANAWARAFAWARANTPVDALFALDPFYLRREGPDTHSFRALAHRSMLAEAVHDLAPAAMSPALGARWVAESQALAGWPRFTPADFARLREQFGVTWIVVTQPRLPALDCPFENEAAAVCRIGAPAEIP